MRSTIVALALLSSACAGPRPANNDAATTDGDMILLFSEKQPEQTRPDSTRMLITKAFLRIDSGPQSEDYILFDRTKRIIYNVVAEDESILVIPYQPVDGAPGEVRWEVTQEQSHALPRTLQGVRATYYRYAVNGQPCYHVVAVENLLEEALAAMAEYRINLAGELAGSYPAPVDQADLCEAMTKVFAPSKPLSHGFPVREWGANGYQRFLMDYQVGLTLPPALFALPQAYSRYSVGDIRAP